MLFMTPGDVEAFVSFVRVTTTTSPLCSFQKDVDGESGTCLMSLWGWGSFLRPVAKFIGAGL
jgi:hypothetical protein